MDDDCDKDEENDETRTISADEAVAESKACPVSEEEGESQLGSTSEEKEESSKYRQLAYVRLSSLVKEESRWIKLGEAFPCDAFALDSDGSAAGFLRYDSAKGCLVALCPVKGMSVLSLEGNVICRRPEIKPNLFLKWRNDYRMGWDYSSKHHVLFRWREGYGVEEIGFDELAGGDKGNI
jgi:hypothetical protein